MWIVFSYIWLPFMILPVYAALERIPHSYIEASRDLGAKGSRTLRSVILPLALPGVVAGSIFTFSLTLGDYITPSLVGGPSSQFIGNVVYDSVNGAGNLPFGAAFAVVPVLDHGRLPRHRPTPRRLRRAVDGEPRAPASRSASGSALVLAFLYIPIVLICLYAFNASNVQSWPIPGLTTQVVLAGDPQRRHAAGALALAEGRSARDRRRARPRHAWRRSAFTASGSSAARRSRSCSSCRSRYPGSSPAWRSTRTSRTGSSTSGC